MTQTVFRGYHMRIFSGNRIMNRHQNPALFAAILIVASAQSATAREAFDLAPCDVLPASSPKGMAPIQLEADKAVSPEKSSSQAASQSLYKQAEKVNVLPLPLIPTQGEMSERREIELSEESKQIAELWSSTIDRSPDIQFVINALQPTTDPRRSRSQAVKMIGGALFNVAQAAPMAMGAPAAVRLGTGMAGSLLDSLWRGNAKEKGTDLSPGSLAAYYSMVRHTADRLVDAFRGYKSALDAAVLSEEFVDDVVTVSNQNLEQQAYFSLELIRAQRDVHLSHKRIDAYRYQLIDMAGLDAVAKLDERIAAERALMARVTGESSWRRPLQYVPSMTTKAPANRTP
jgi:hypothetical protein